MLCPPFFVTNSTTTGMRFTTVSVESPSFWNVGPSEATAPVEPPS